MTSGDRQLSPSELDAFRSVADFESEAEAILPGMFFDYYAGGADSEITVRENNAAWERLALRPHVLQDVRSVSTATAVLGDEISMPIMIGPTGHQRLADDAGDVATAVAAAEAGTIFILSTFSSIALEDVAAATPRSPKWFQLYIHRDRDLTSDLVRRADFAGYKAIVVTVDVPILGNRLRDTRNRFALPEGVGLGNFQQSLPDAPGSALGAYTDSQLDPGITLEDLSWLRGVTSLPLVVKGVMRDDDAWEIVNAGVEGIVVSNHGGRQLDGTQATATVLEQIADRVGDRCEVYVDGGVTTGSDVVRAIALGADAVLVGRPALWGLAVGGAQGVSRVLQILRDETERTLGLCGVDSVRAVTRDLVA